MTLRTKNLIAFLGMTILVLLLHILATKMSLYYIFWWYDSLLHILGGMAVAFFGAAIIFRKQHIWIPILATTIGIAWELFERLGHVWWPTFVGFGGTWDTVFDILCAILGSLIITTFSLSWQKNNTTRT